MQAVNRHIDSTKHLTHVESPCNDVSAVVRLGDITKALGQQIRSDAQQLKSIYAEQNKLRPHVMRFRDLERDAQRREARLKRTISLLGVDQYPDAKEYAREADDSSNAMPLVIDDIPLWQAIVTVVEQASPIRWLSCSTSWNSLGGKRLAKPSNRRLPLTRMFLSSNCGAERSSSR